MIVLTPDGRLARYLFGIEYWPRDLRLALVEASAGKVGSPVDALLLYCFHYNPMTGRYGLVIMRAMRLAGARHRPRARIVHFHHAARRRRRRHQHPLEALMMCPAPRSSPSAASTMASRVDALYFFLIAITVFFSLLIAGLIVFYAVKYRRRSPGSGRRTHSRRPDARD